MPKIIGNKPKFYEKARAWYKKQGKIDVPGFKRIEIKNNKNSLLVVFNGKRYELRKFGQGYANILRKKPIYTFVSEQGRILVVTEFLHKTLTKELVLEIDAYHADLLAGDVGFRRLLHTNVNIILDLEIAYDSYFYWCQGVNKKHLTGQAPEWLKGKGFGLFVESLRQIRLAKLGVSKWFASIIPEKESLEFAELRGFRKPTLEEILLLAKATLRKEPDKRTIRQMLKIYHVKDIPPIKGK
ncbi:MAG: hypothetical protein QXM75_00055 [Candidatus Diapherotrites archaeon]